MALHTTSRAASDFDMPAAATETEPTPRRRSPGLRRLKRIGWNLIPPLTFVAIVGLWSLAIQIFKIPAYLLPGPGAVFQRLVVDAGMTVGDSHVICDRIEDALKAEIPSVRVTIHVEPDDEAKLPKGTTAVPFA